MQVLLTLLDGYASSMKSKQQAVFFLESAESPTHLAKCGLTSLCAFPVRAGYLQHDQAISPRHSNCPSP